MKTYLIEWEKRAIKELAKLDKKVASFLVEEVEINLSSDPYRFGKTRALAGKWEGFRRLRINDYRIIYQVFDEKVMIRVCKLGHRREIYC